MLLPRRASFGLIALLTLALGGCKSNLTVSPPSNLGVPVMFGNRVTPAREAGTLGGGQNFVVGDNKGADTQLSTSGGTTTRTTTSTTRTAIDRYVARGVQNGRFVSRASVEYEGVLIMGMAFTDWIWLRGTFASKPR
jgi:hypothetical protein